MPRFTALFVVALLWAAGGTCFAHANGANGFDFASLDAAASTNPFTAIMEMAYAGSASKEASTAIGPFASLPDRTAQSLSDASAPQSATSSSQDDEPYTIVVSDRAEPLEPVPSRLNGVLIASIERQVAHMREAVPNARHAVPAEQAATRTAAVGRGAQGAMTESNREMAAAVTKDGARSIAPKPVKEAKQRRMYVVPLAISAETARQMELAPGDFPANYLENQKKDGMWGKRAKTVARVVPASNGGYSCTIYLERPPAKNSAVAIDFLNGNSIEVASNMLQGTIVPTPSPPKLKKRQYDALKAAYHVKTPWLLTLAKLVLPAAPQVVMGSMTMGMTGAAMPVAGLVQGLAIRKIVGNHRELAVAQNPALRVNYVLATQSEKLDWQDARIASLELQIKTLQAQIGKLQLTSAVQTRPLERKKK